MIAPVHVHGSDAAIPAPPGLALGAQISRRRLLELGGAAALGALVAGPWPNPGPAGGSAATATPAHLLRSAYAGLVGERFTVARADAAPVALRLVAVNDLQRSAAGHEEAFSLLFAGAASAPLEQAVRELRHPSLGRFSLLLVPTTTRRRGPHYEAIVNRLRPART